MGRRLPLLVAALALVTHLAAADTATTPEVIAVDTSRSLTAAELGAAGSLLGRALASQPEQTAVGLLEFNDTPRWVARPGSSPSAIRAGLSGLVPGGRLTVLRDALFVAIKEMPAGGVVLLASDGRDEDSATTVEDVVRLAVEHHVRVVAVGAGRRVDERALRRLALLTDGEYLGRLPDVSASAVGGALERARRGPLRGVATPPPVQPAESSRPEPSPIPTSVPTPPAATSTGIADLLLPLLAVVGLAGGVVAVLLLRARRARAERACPRCGAELAAWETECPHCQIEELQDHLAADSSPAEMADESLLDPAVFEKIPLEERLEKTFALGEQPVLVVKERKKPPRSYMLHAGRVFSVGRAAQVNTLAFEDPTLSGQHFKVVAKEGEFFVVDLQSTNGTIVNGDRVRARRLKNGDVIRAGEVEFEFRVQYMRTA